MRELQAPPEQRRLTKPKELVSRQTKAAGDREQERERTEAEVDEAEQRKAILGRTVANRIREAMMARESSGIEDEWLAVEDQYNGVDELSVDNRRAVKTAEQAVNTTADGRSRIFLNITKPKTDAGVARVQEMLVPNDDKPWEIGPTPIPELSAEAERELSSRQITLPDGTTQKPDGSPLTAKDVAQIVIDKANEAAGHMGTWIEDHFVEGEVYSHMRKVIRSAGRLGTGVLKGPTAVERKDRKWRIQNGEALLEVVKRTAPTSVEISPWDCYPDPACGENIHNGSYFVERAYMTARQLRALAGLEGYDRQAIGAALLEGPRSRGRDRHRFRDEPGETVSDSDIFEVFYYYGDCTPDDLMLMGVDSEGMTPEELALEAVPAIVTVLNDRPIKAVANPLETGEFPYDFFPWEPVSGQPWGRGIPTKMATAQRLLNASVRRMLENAGLSAGPQIAITNGALVPVNGRYEVVGPKLWHFTPTAELDDIRKAMEVWIIPSVQEELGRIIEFALKMADELTNLPMLLQGQQGTAPDLLGGMQMLMANANAPLRVIAKQYDDYLIVRHLRRYNDWGMQSAPAKCKGDHQIKARGATALVQREMAREFLMQLYAVKDDPSLKIDPVKFAAELARSNGFNMANIQYSDEDWAKLQKQMQENPPPGDPRVEAVRLRNEGVRVQAEMRMQSDEREREFKAGQQAQQQAHEAAMAAIDRQLEMLKVAGQESISLAQVQAMLAGKAMDDNTRRTEMALKLSPQNPTNEGV